MERRWMVSVGQETLLSECVAIDWVGGVDRITLLFESLLQAFGGEYKWEKSLFVFGIEWDIEC